MKQETSAGAVIFRDRKAPKFLLLKYSSHWGLVKGHLEEGETPEEAMRRETEEETGITDLRIIPGFKEETSYFYRKGRETVKKKVIWFLCLTKTRQVKISHEHEDFKWVGQEDVISELTYENTKEIMKKALSLIRQQSFFD